MSKNVKLIALAIDKNFSALFSMFETQPFGIGDFLLFYCVNFFRQTTSRTSKHMPYKIIKIPLSNLKRSIQRPLDQARLC